MRVLACPLVAVLLLGRLGSRAADAAGPCCGTADQGDDGRGCDGGWVIDMRAKGYDVTVIEVDDVDLIKRKHGMPDHLGSCHTSLVWGYVVKEHHPAPAIAKLLAEWPPMKGIALPGMPTARPA